MSLFENLKKMIMFSISSVIFFTGALIGYVAFHDYILVKFYDLALNLQSSGLISNNIVLSIDSVQNLTNLIPTIIDKLWFVGFVFFLISIGRGVLQTKREGYFSTIGSLTYGVIILMFISGIVEQVANYVNNILFSLIPALTSQATLMAFYMNNLGVINLSLSLFFILLSFVDLKKLKQRQSIQRETIPTQTISDEI